MTLNKLLRDSILEKRNLDIIKFLIEKGADIHQKDHNDNLLHITLRYNIINYQLIIFLIENNIDLVSKDNFDKTPLDYLLDHLLESNNLKNYPFDYIIKLMKQKGLCIDSISYRKSNQLSQINFLDNPLHFGC
jgi:ankyrin repeat protein